MKRILNKIICLTLCLIVGICSCPLMTSADEPVLTREEQTLLEALGFYSNFSDAKLTKMDYTKALMHARGLSGLISTSSTAMAKTAVEYGILPAYDDGGANMESSVTWGEAASGLIKILGHDVMIAESERNQTRYLNRAAELGITKGFSYAQQDAITAAEFAVVFYRALHTDIVLMESYGNMGYTLREEQGETLLTYYHSIYKDRGQVTGNEFSTLTTANGVGKDKVMIDSTYTLAVGDTDAVHYLGYYVTYYYHTDENDENTLIWIVKDSSCDQIYLESHEIDGNEGFSYLYTEGNRTKKAKLASNAAVIYNGVAVAFSSLTDEEKIPTLGEITLVSVDGDDLYDVLIIMNYVGCIAGNYNAMTEQLADSQGNVILSFDSGDFLLYNESYKTLQPGSLANGPALWIAVSKDGGLTTVLASTETVSGTVTEVSTNDGKVTASIDGVPYPLSPFCRFANQLKIGTSATFYLDVSGKIAGFDATGSTDAQYIFMADGIMKDHLGKYIAFKAFDGDFFELQTASTITLNGETARTAEEMWEPFDDGAGGFKPQLIRCRYNEDKKITMIETATTLAEGEEVADRLHIFHEVPYSAENTGLYSLPHWGYQFAGSYALSSSTIVFSIPSDGTDSKYRKGTRADIAEGFKNNMIAYKTNSASAYPDVVVWTMPTGSSGGGNLESVTAEGPYMVSSITTALNDDGDEIVKLEYYLTNNYVGAQKNSATVTDLDLVAIVKDGEIQGDADDDPNLTDAEKAAYAAQEELRKVKVGDMVRLDKDATEEVTRFVKCFDYASGKMINTLDESGWLAKWRVGNGIVNKHMKELILVTPDKNPTATDFLYNINCKIGIYDVNRGVMTATAGTMADIVVGDRVLYGSRNGCLLSILVIR